MTAAVETPWIPVVLMFRSADLDPAEAEHAVIPSRIHGLMLPGLREFRDRHLRHRYRDYTARDETIKVIPNRRPAWMKAPPRS